MSILICALAIPFTFFCRCFIVPLYDCFIQPHLALVIPVLHLLIMLAPVINFVSHLVYIYYLDEAYLQQINPVCTGKRMTYLIADNLHQPLTTFQFLMGDIADNGITTVNYSSYKFRPERIAMQIINDINAHDYDAVIYTFSVGDQVGYYIRRACGDKVPVITVNPCTTPFFLKQPAYIVTKTFAPILVALGWLLGWLSEIKCIAIGNDRYTLASLLTQWFQITHGPKISFNANQTTPAGIICSRNNQLLNHCKIEAVYPQAPIEYINSARGDTVGDSEQYLASLRTIYRRSDYGGHISNLIYAKSIYYQDLCKE